MTTHPVSTLICRDLGTLAYPAGLELQIASVDRLKADPAAQDVLLLVEHDPPVLTLGRGADDANILLPREQLAARGVTVWETARGGEVTWHGRGQLVGYPILRLDRRQRDLHAYLRNLEEVLIRLLGRYGLQGIRVRGWTGVWVGDRKVAAIGIAVTRWITYHGFALNVCPDLSGFEAIIPCGIRERGVTSMADLLGRPVTVEEIKGPLVECFAEVFEYDRVVREP